MRDLEIILNFFANVRHVTARDELVELLDRARVIVYPLDVTAAVVEEAEERVVDANRSAQVLQVFLGHIHEVVVGIKRAAAFGMEPGDKRPSRRNAPCLNTSLLRIDAIRQNIS